MRSLLLVLALLVPTVGAAAETLQEDPSADGREQAVFALSELPDERAVGSLTQIVRDTGMDLAIREQALFWLAQSDSDEAYEVIDSLLSKGQ